MCPFQSGRLRLGGRLPLPYASPSRCLIPSRSSIRVSALTITGGDESTRRAYQRLLTPSQTCHPGNSRSRSSAVSSPASTVSQSRHTRLIRIASRRIQTVFHLFVHVRGL
jgi:hypothetical protein